MQKGRIIRINGPLVIAQDVPNAKIGDIVYLGEEKLIGEIVRIFGNKVACQCYEDTSGLKPGDPAINTGEPLSAELGPGLIGQIFDGLEFSELELWREYGPFMQRGAKIERLDKKKKWSFIPTVKPGEEVVEGDILGTIHETSAVIHRILMPVGIKKAKVLEIYEGSFTVVEPIALIETSNGEKRELTMLQRWPVRLNRPYKERLPSTEPLITGQRVIDTFFPVAKGGTAAIPGGFGTGKTVTLQQLAKWSDADIVIYIGCGERGNEMADVITHFPEIKDPRTGKRLIERSIFIANVSNLPVYAREASIYLGVTIGEYFRDQGYSVALMADSTSRWAEALRDISGRLEEIPAERGFPAYLAERIAEFYERAGRVITLGKDNRIGALTIMGAVSPPGGDFSEPVTSITLRFVGTLWALDKELAFRRHFPAINWLLSFSRYLDQLAGYWTRVDHDFPRFREEALSLLQEAAKIEEIARIVGEKALPESQKLILLIAEILREGYLIQNAFHPVDTYCPPEKQAKMLRIIMEFYALAKKLVENNVPVDRIRELSGIIRNLKMMKEMERLEDVEATGNQAKEALVKLAEEYGISLEET
ncbi:MAG: V-type ATP synthase subunit A [Candidatus Njordarchaeales archaeon]